MRLHRITLRDVRAVTDRTVHLPGSGVVVIEGPNEIGKSTMLEAFDRLLELKSTSSSAKVRDLQPIGRDVGPFVEAEFTVAGSRVRLAKRWLRSPLTELEILSPTPTQLTGAAAEARVEQLLKGSLDTTLWEALRFTQSGDGTVVPLVSSGVLREALDGAADANGHDEGGDRVLDLVETEYLQYFTARTARPTGAYKAAISDHTQAQAEVAEAHRRLTEAEELLRRQGQAREEARDAVTRVESAQGAWETARRRRAEVADLEAAQEATEASHREMRERSRSAAGRLAARRRQVAEVEMLTESVADLETQRVALTAKAAQLASAVQDAESAVVDADADVEAAEAWLEQARADREAVADQQRVGDLERAIEDIRERAGAVARSEEAMPQISVSSDDLHEVDRLARELAVLEAQHEAASARVLVQSLGETAQVTPGSSTSVEVDWAAPQTFVATDDLEVTVPGAVRVRVQPAADAGQRLMRLTAARVAVNSALYELGCCSLEDVHLRARQTQAAQARLRESYRDLEALLSAHGADAPRDRAQTLDGGAPERLVTELEETRARVTTSRQHRSAEVNLPALPSSAAQARQVEQEAAADLRGRRAARRDAAAALTQSRTAVRDLTQALDRLQGRLQSEQSRLATQVEGLAAARAEGGDELLERQAQDLVEAERAAHAKVQAAHAAVQAADVAGRAALEEATRQDLARAQGELERARQRLHTVTGQVELAASEGRQELYDLAEAALDECERRLAGLDRRARAVRHLRSTLHEHRDAAHRAYVRPFTQALERLGRQVYGDTFGVSVGEDLSVQARTLDGTTVVFDQLSGGAKEQLGILARLAVAHLVDPDQGVPVVIDDALGYSDPARLEQMGQVLGSEAASGEDVQVILLTCTPQRYAAIPNVHTVRLTA